jgi:sugar lactone lactonase YvrE
MDTDKEAAGFERIVPRNAILDRIACQLIFGEGPVWNARQGYLSWVDIVGNGRPVPAPRSFFDRQGKRTA